MIRVCVVEDQTLVREGICGLLRLVPDIEVVAEAADGDEALRVIAACRPDVVLLDLRMPKRSGIEVMRHLQAQNAVPPTLVLTTFDDDDEALEAIRAGATGFLLKDVSLEQLAAAVRTVAAGQVLFQPGLTERLLRSATGRPSAFPSAARPQTPTDRELAVLRLMANGYSNSEIASALDLAEGTVKNHVSAVLLKLGVRDRTRAVLKALELDLL